MSEGIVELADLPRCEPNTSATRVLAKQDRAVVVYECCGHGWPDSHSFAVVLFKRCFSFRGGGPNDEAFRNHELFREGLESCRLQEVIGGTWLRERAKVVDRDGDGAHRMRTARHFVFAVKEDTFECAADTYALIGVFATEGEAVHAALAAVASEP